MPERRAPLDEVLMLPGARPPTRAARRLCASCAGALLLARAPGASAEPATAPAAPSAPGAPAPAASAPSSAVALASSPEVPGSATRVVDAPGSISLDAAPPPVGGASISWGLVGVDTPGTWAVRPRPFGRLDPQIAVVGGEIRLSPRLSVLLYGADEFMLHRFSGMTAGLMLRPLPGLSWFQPTFSLGYSEDLGGAQVAWGRVGATMSWGAFRLGYALRGAAAVGDGSPSQPSAVASAAVAYEQKRFSLGFEALREWRPGAPARTVLVPSASVRPSEASEVRVSSGVSPQGASSPFKISYVNRF